MRSPLIFVALNVMACGSRVVEYSATNLDDIRDSTVDTQPDTHTPTVDSSSPDVGSECVLDALCGDGRLCRPTDAGRECIPCTKDAQCASALSGTLCYSGRCLVGQCHPGASADVCRVCCASSKSPGECISHAEAIPCCNDSDCLGVACDLTTKSCKCPPPGDQLIVSPKGDDARGNGSTTCPYKTIAKAVAVANWTLAKAIVLETAGYAPAVFGSGCSGGPPCDTTPITIPVFGITLKDHVTIKGAGAPGDVLVTGDAKNLFVVRASAVSFESMTIEPTLKGVQRDGGYGISYECADTSVEHGVRNVVFRGAGGTGKGLGFVGVGGGIALMSDGDLTIGPGVTFSGMYDGVFVFNRASAHIVGTAAAPTRFDSLEGVAVSLQSIPPTVPTRIETLGSGTGVVMHNCSNGVDQWGLGVVATHMSGVAITHDSETVVAGSGIAVNRGSLEATSVSITGRYNPAVHVATGASFTGSSLSIRGAESGVGVLGRARLTRMDVRGSHVSGIVCGGGDLTLRESTTLGNMSSGVVLDACTADLGTTSDPGRNVFNTTSQPNGATGLCVLNATMLSAPTASFGCGYTGTGCVPSAGTLAPKSIASSVCSAGFDLVYPSGATVTTPSASCCN